MVKKARNVFIVLFHNYVTKNGENQVVERCEFVDNLTRRHLDSSTVIIDFLEEKVVKNRAKEGEYSDFVQYLNEQYPTQMKELHSEYKDDTIETDTAETKETTDQES